MVVVPSDTANSLWGQSYPWVAADLGGSAGTTWTPYSRNDGADDQEVHSESLGPAAILGAGVSYRAWTTKLRTINDGGDGAYVDTQSTAMTVLDSFGVALWSASGGGHESTAGSWYSTAIAFLRSHHGPGR